MIFEIKYIAKILIQEIFKTKHIYLMMYGLIILVSSILYMQDFSMKITANLILIIWISLMGVIGFKVFLQDGRESLFLIDKTHLFLKYIRLIFAQMILNIPLLLCIGCQLFFLKQNLLKILFLTIISYLFAIMFGFLLGNIVSKTNGIMILAFVFLYNFLWVNPYKLTEYTYFFGINEFLFNLDRLNVINLLKMLLIISSSIIIVFFSGKYLFSQKGKYVIFIFILLGFVILESAQYRFYLLGKNTEAKIMYIKDKKVIFMNMNFLEYEKGVELLQKIQDFHINIGGSSVKSYVIEKNFLSSLWWKFIRQSEIYEFKKDYLKVNIYSLAASNFYEPSIVYRNAQDMVGVWARTIPDYVNGNRYFRHIIDGSGEVFMVKSLGSIYTENSVVPEYAQFELEITYNSPITENNYVKRIGILVADKHETQLVDLVKVVGKGKFGSNKEFINVLKDRFPDIYYDPYIHDFLKKMLEE